MQNAFAVLAFSYILAEMINWVLECSWLDIEDESDLDEFSLWQLIRGVHKNSDGGMESFLLAIF